MINNFIKSPMFLEYKRENEFLNNVAAWAKLGEQDYVRREIYRSFNGIIAYSTKNTAEVFNRLMVRKLFADICANYMNGVATEEEWLAARKEYGRQDKRFWCYGSYNIKCLPLPK